MAKDYTRTQLRNRSCGFTNRMRLFSVPQFLIEKALGRKLDDEEPVYLVFRMRKKEGYTALVITAHTVKPREKSSFKGFKTNPNCTRFHVSGITIGRALGLNANKAGKRKFPSTVSNGEILCPIPEFLGKPRI